MSGTNFHQKNYLFTLFYKKSFKIFKKIIVTFPISDAKIDIYFTISKCYNSEIGYGFTP